MKYILETKEQGSHDAKQVNNWITKKSTGSGGLVVNEKVQYYCINRQLKNEK